MSAETTNWALLGFIMLQAAFMSWATHDSHKSFTALSNQVGRLIDMLQEFIDIENGTKPSVLPPADVGGTGNG